MKSIYVNGIDLFYDDIGEGKDVILFLHGLGSNAASWEYQVEFFREEYRLIIPDLRGHGLSALGDTQFSLALCADDMVMLLDRLGIKKVHLCGFSLGGMIAFEFAVRHSAYLNSLCCVNASASLKLKSFKMRFLYFIRKVASRILPLSWIAYIIALKLFPNNTFLRIKLMKTVPSINHESYVRVIDTLENWSVLEFLDTFNTKTLMIGSEFDYEVFKDKKSVVKKMIQAEFVQIDDAHHFVIWEYPSRFNKIYKSFLED